MKPQTTNRERPFLVYLDPETHMQLKLKGVKQNESMRSIIRRLAGLYVAGKLPQAEPKQASS